MNILLFSPLPPPLGGIATWTEAYCAYCSRNGHEVRVVNTAMIGTRTQTQKMRFAEELVRGFRIFIDAWKQLRTWKVDAVHINSACSKFGLLRDVGCLLLAGGIQTNLQCHCNVADQLGSGGFTGKIFSYAVRKADHVFVLNQASYELVKNCGCQSVEIVPNFIEKEALKERRATGEKVRKILYVGHVRREKGIFELLEAAKGLPDVAFWLVGPIYENLENLTIRENVKAVGAKPKADVFALLDSADVFLFPSYTEGFSNALLEAMARGLPVIATDVGANREMLEDRGGILIPPGDSEAIVAAISAMQDPLLRQRMSEWNMQKVASCYTTDVVVQRILARTEALRK